jgi:hypothetical protein
LFNRYGLLATGFWLLAALLGFEVLLFVKLPEARSQEPEAKRLLLV